MNFLFQRSRSGHSQRNRQIFSPDIKSPPSLRSAEKKAPRTVHIDVYCTGSDAEDSSDSRSSSPSVDHFKEDESVSTPQTVYDSSQMHLKHQRVHDHHDLPRRLGGNLTTDSRLNLGRVDSPSNLREFLLSKSDTKDEINESKQMLFDKHVGSDVNHNTRQSRFGSRNRINFRKDASDDCISSNYPNSSRSTVRDLTCSSISSAMAGNSFNNDDYESSWKETDVDATYQSSIAPSESFEYDNNRDRSRIRQMDERWGRMQAWRSATDRDRKWQHVSLDDFAEEDVKPPGNETFENVYDINRPSYPQPTPITTTGTIPGPSEGPAPASAATTNYQPTHSVIKEDGNAYAHRLVLQRSISSNAPTNNLPETIYHPARRVIFQPYRTSSSQSSSVQSRVSGYTREHLAKAHRFGSVVPAIRKPGHHVGPAKNPDCQCDTCKRWFAERESGRARASSVGDIPFHRPTFWPGRYEE